MNFREHIHRVTSLKHCEIQNVKWKPVEQTETNKLPHNKPREKGEKPYQLNISSNYHSSSSSQNSPVGKKPVKDKRPNHQKKMNEHSNQHQFASIIPSVREASGGWNTQSNEAIERRHRERQQKWVEDNIKLNSSDSCNATFSSESSESYKTTHQDSCDIRMANDKLVTSNEQVTSEPQTKSELQRYKKNALMLGLLTKADYTDVEREDTTTESSEDYYDTKSFEDAASGITNLNINDENVMHNERIGRFFQSQEDEDVYCHPLREEIQKDPEWQKFALKRKGIEIVYSPRQHFLNIADDEFAFESRKPK